MQSSAAIRSLRLLPSARTCLLPLARASTTPFKTADPAVHSESPQGEDADEAAKADAAADREHPPRRKEFQSTANDPTEPVKTPPFASSAKLERTEVGPTAEPTFQQKRRWSHASQPIDNVACIGPDGTPLDGSPLDDNKQGMNRDQRADKDRDYYEHHKASPLSEIEFVDTRRPISRARDGEKRDDVWGGEGKGYVIRESVDDALRRAEAMFNEARERGDPSLPHSRALMRKIQELCQAERRVIRGEYRSREHSC